MAWRYCWGFCVQALGSHLFERKAFCREPLWSPRRWVAVLMPGVSQLTACICCAGLTPDQVRAKIGSERRGIPAPHDATVGDAFNAFCNIEQIRGTRPSTLCLDVSISAPRLPTTAVELGRLHGFTRSTGARVLS